MEDFDAIPAMKPLQTVAFLSAGGLAPCLSSALGYLIEAYSVRSPKTRLICYKGGYKGLLSGDVVAESTANPRMFIVHEVMGRDCGWLTAATAAAYMKKLSEHTLLPELFVDDKRLAVHAVYIPEMAIDMKAESQRLKAIMDEYDCVNIFISEGAGVKDIVKELEAKGVDVPRDAFGHVKL